MGVGQGKSWHELETRTVTGWVLPGREVGQGQLWGHFAGRNVGLGCRSVTVGPLVPLPPAERGFVSVSEGGESVRGCSQGPEHERGINCLLLYAAKFWNC